MGSPTPLSQKGQWTQIDQPLAVMPVTDSALIVTEPDGRLVTDQAELFAPVADPDGQGANSPVDKGPFLPPADICRRFWADDAYGRVVLDGDGTILWLNTAAAEMTGLPTAEVVGRNMVEFVGADHIAVAVDAVAEIQGELSTQEEGVPLVIELTRADGSTVHVEVGAANYLDVAGVEAIAVRLRPYESQRYLERFLVDLVAGAPMDANLKLLIQSLDHLLQESATAIVHGWDGTVFTELVTVALPDVLTGMVQMPSEDADRLPWARCRLSGETEWSVVEDLPEPVRAVAAGLGLRACWARPIIVPPEGVIAVIIVWRRLPSSLRIGHRHALERSCLAAALAFERRRAELLLVRAATVDPLTGIPNRSQFFASLELSMNTSEPGRLGVLYLDLDGFKPINDNHGHRFGDHLLAEIGTLLGDNVRPGDMVARLGGDEFAVLCAEVGGEEELCEVAERLIKVVSQPLALNGIEVSIGVSIGVALAKVHGQTHDEVLDSADAALYRAKRAGRGRYSVALPS